MASSAGLSGFARIPQLGPRAVAERDAILKNPGFGATISDQMVEIDLDPAKGWHGARAIPYGPIALDPAAAVLRNAQ